MTDALNVITLAAETAKAGWWPAVLPLVGTLIGATIASGTSYWVARQAVKNARETANQQRRDHEKIATMRTMIKLMRLANSLRGLQAQMKEARDLGERQGFNLDQPASYIRAVKIDDAAFIHFEVDELVVFLEAREMNFLNRIIILGDRYNGLMEGIRAYGEMRNEFLNQFPAVIQGDVGHPILDEQQQLLAAPQFANLNVIARQTVEHVDEHLEEAKALVGLFGPIVKTYFADPTFPAPALAANPPPQAPVAAVDAP